MLFRSLSFAEGTEQQVLRVNYTKAQLGQAAGRETLAIAAVTDVQMALALVKALEGSPWTEKALEVLTVKAAKAKKRQAEARAHKRNVRMGKKK